jgi:uncharacterized membrane protein
MNTFFKLMIWPVLLAPVIYLAVIWSSLPARVAVHFDITGTPDRFGPKSETAIAVAIITIISIAMYLFLPLVYKIDPKKTAVENKPRLKKISIATALFLSFIGCVIVSSSQNGGIKMSMQLLFGGIGLLWCVLGNYMYNIKPNFFAGIRVPWTLSNEDNWKQTHRLAGKLWFAGGLLTLLAAILLPQSWLIVVFITIAICTGVIPMIFSYLLFKKQKVSH